MGIPASGALAQLSKEHAGLALLVDYDQLYLLSSGFSGPIQVILYFFLQSGQ
jgi:hypothetical protein